MAAPPPGETLESAFLEPYGAAADNDMNARKLLARSAIAEEEIALAETELRVKRLRLAKQARDLEKQVELLASQPPPAKKSSWWQKLCSCGAR